MTNYAAQDVDDYIAKGPERSRPHLTEVRAAIRSAVPDAEETISWGKPYYRRQGMLGGFDAFRNHVSVEIWADELSKEDRNALEEAGYRTGKRTFQIGYDQKVPATMIENLFAARARANELKARER